MSVKRYNIYLGERKEILGEFREKQSENGPILEMEIYKGHYTPIGFRCALGDLSLYSGIIDDKSVREIIEDRVVPPTRINIKDILKSIGMEKYDAYEIYKYNNGMSRMDECWIDFEHEKKGC